MCTCEHITGAGLISIKNCEGKWLKTDVNWKLDKIVSRKGAKARRDGFGLWAVEVPGVAEFVGFVGLNRPNFDAHFTPCVEIGWRLAYEFWGRGYATEAARAALQYGFEQLPLEEIVSFTTVANKRSRPPDGAVGHDPFNSRRF